MVSSSPRRRRPESAARAPRVVAHPRVSELAFRRDGTTGFPGGRRDGAGPSGPRATRGGRAVATPSRRDASFAVSTGVDAVRDGIRRDDAVAPRGVSEPDEPVARGVEPSWRKPCRARRSPGSGPRARRLASRRGVERVHRLRRDDDAFSVACDARHGGVIVERAAVGRADSERGLLGFFRAPVHGRQHLISFPPPVAAAPNAVRVGGAPDVLSRPPRSPPRSHALTSPPP